MGHTRQAAGETFVFQTWNLWHGGSMIDQGHQKMVNIIENTRADIVALQECSGNRAESLSVATGRQHAQQDTDCAISAIGRVDLIETGTAPFATAAWVRVRGAFERPILTWSVHLAHRDYGPYSALDGAKQEVVSSLPDEVLRREQIVRVLGETAKLTAGQKDIPVIIAGDFNSPATRDWQQRLDLPAYNWLSTDEPLRAGFKDAFREIYPDATRVWGDTWSPIEPLEKEPRDRIDFVFVKNLHVLDARVRGTVVKDEKGYQAPEFTPRRGGNLPNLSSAETDYVSGSSVVECGADWVSGDLASGEQPFINVGSVARLRPDHRSNSYPSDHNIVEVKLGFLY